MIIRPKVYDLYLPEVMSFYLVPHLPRLVAMVAKFFVCKRKVASLFFIFFIYVILSLSFLFSLTSKVCNVKCKKSKYSLLFVSGTTAILPYERCACFDND